MAASVLLKSGKRVQGSILSMDAEVVNVQDEKGVKSQILRSLIENIDLDSKKKPASKTKTPSLLSPTPPHFNPSEVMPPSKEQQALFEQLFNGPKEEDMQKGPYATPKNTFETWRRASVKGDTKKMILCYVSFRQNQIKKQLKKIPRNKRKDMQEASNNTLFSLGKPYYQGDRASLEVTWNHGLRSDTQTLRFMLEKQEWKIVQ